MKKIKFLLCAGVLAMAAFAPSAFATGAYSTDDVYFADLINYYDVDAKSGKTNYVIDKKPKATINFKINNNDNVYKVRLTAATGGSEVVRLYSDGTDILEQILEFPVKQQGTQSLKIELIENDVVVYSKDYTVDYIKSVKTSGYGNRGFCTHFAHGTYNAKDAALLSAVGAETYRDNFYWSGVEPSTKGIYTFSGYNSLYKSSRATGKEMFCVVSGTNSLYMNMDADISDIDQVVTETNTQEVIDNKIKNRRLKITSDEQVEGFANFVLACVKNNPDVTKYEIYNEPAFSYTGAEYKKLVLATAKKVKAYDPDVEIYAGSMVGDSRAVQTKDVFMSEFYDEELYPYVDGVCFHVYTVGYYADNTTFDDHVDTYTIQLHNQGGWKDLAITETGWYVIRPSKNWGPTLERQAHELVKRSVICDDRDISVLTLYDFKNDGTNNSNEEHMWGVMTNDYQMRPSYYSMQEYFENVNQAQYLGRVKLDAEGKIDAYAYAKNDDYFLVTWAKTTLMDQKGDYNYNPYVLNTSTLQKTTYTFTEDVKITDMYGNDTATGKVLNADWDPKYVHNLSREFILNALSAYGTEELVDKTAFTAVGYDTQYNALAAKYLEICEGKTQADVMDFITLCDETAKAAIANHSGMTDKQFSNLLSEIAEFMEKGARLLACCETADDDTELEKIKFQYDQISDVIEFADMSGLIYLSEPYTEGRKILKKTEKYEDVTRAAALSGANYNMNSTGMLTIGGTTSEKYVTVSITSGEDTIYIDTIPAADGKYSTYCQLPEYGDYVLKIKNGSTMDTNEIAYKETKYISVENKMTAADNKRAEILLGWSKLLMADYLEANKGYTFAEKMPENVTKYSDGDKTYIKVKLDKNADGVTAGALYVNDALASVVVAENGECIIDITGIDKYKVKLFRWSSLADMKPLDTPATIVTVNK